MYKFSPSMMCMDVLQFKKQIEFLNSVADYFHVDIMDGHFVPNITLSPFFIEQMRKVSTKPIDSHLMVEKPQNFIESCFQSGTSLFEFHAEVAEGEAFRMISSIKAKGGKVGVVLNPETLPSRVDYYLDLVDRVTIMSVDPGFAGQAFIRQSLKKIEEFREIKTAKGLSYEIEVDGSCNVKTFRDLASAGTEVFVVGSSGLFNLDADLATAWKIMMENFDAAVAGVSF